MSQQLGANILDVRAGVEEALSELARSAARRRCALSKIYDLAEFVATAIANVRDAILIGGLLAVVVLFVFLRDWRMTLVARYAAADRPRHLPLHAAVRRVDQPDVDGRPRRRHRPRHRRRGGGGGEHPPASRRGETAPPRSHTATRELVAPVVGSTLTTVVVFAPLGLLSGVVGQFFRALSMTLSAAVLVSLVLALTLIPLLARPPRAHRARCP